MLPRAPECLKVFSSQVEGRRSLDEERGLSGKGGSSEDEYRGLGELGLLSMECATVFTERNQGVRFCHF